jgi:hypothetical protein
MKHGATVFLKLILLLIAIGTLTVLVRFPQTEGRAANLDAISIYTDPFILYLYIASIPFFVALFQAMRLLGFIEKDEAFSQPAVKAVKTIKYCALATMGFLVVALGWVRFASGGDDPAGAVVVGLFLTLTAVVIATATSVFQRLLQNAVAMKSAHDGAVLGGHP